MKKNLFDIDTKNELIDRANALKRTNQGKWGTLNCTEMLLHCNISLNVIMNSKPTARKSSIRNRLLKVAFLWFLKKFPEGARTKKEIDVKGSGLKPGTFEEEKDTFIQSVSQFQQCENITAFHPYFGRLNKKEWGIFTWMHLDHHLRQFDC